MKASTLITGYSIPLVGFGTFKIKGKDLVYSSIDAALKSGYRSIDTAGVYRNESDIGDCLKKCLPAHGLKREDIFVTSKLGPKDQGKSTCRAACLKSLENLKCDYLDLYLIHWPGAQGMPPSDSRHRKLRLESWQDMIRLQQEGKVRSIGVSNFLQHHIEDFIKETNVTPAVLQNEFHPHLVQSELVKFCQERNIHFQAYSSLGTTTDENKLMKDPVVIRIAKSNGVSVPRLLLRWAVQQGVGVLPKSCNAEHIADNIDIFNFTLSAEDMKSLYDLDTQHHYCWDPRTVL